MGRKKLSQATKVRNYMAKHPKAMPAQIAEALGVKVEYVHVLRWAEKKKAQANKTTVSASEVIAAQKAGISIEEVARKKIAEKKAKVKPKLTLDSMPKVGDTIGGLTLTREEKDGGFVYTWVRQKEASNSDPVNHPAHYKAGGIETIDFIEAKGLNYRLGNVVKYVTRADHKGNRKQDLEKAMWYLRREIETSQSA